MKKLFFFFFFNKSSDKLQQANTTLGTGHSFHKEMQIQMYLFLFSIFPQFYLMYYIGIGILYVFICCFLMRCCIAGDGVCVSFVLYSVSLEIYFLCFVCKSTIQNCDCLPLSLLSFLLVQSKCSSLLLFSLNILFSPPYSLQNHERYLKSDDV